MKIFINLWIVLFEFDIYNKLKKVNMTSQEIYETMEMHWIAFKENHERFTTKQVKAAGVRARKSINELKKLTSKYRSTQLAESKGE